MAGVTITLPRFARKRRVTRGTSRLRNGWIASSEREECYGRARREFLWNSGRFPTLIQSGRWAPPESGQATAASLRAKTRVARAVLAREAAGQVRAQPARLRGGPHTSSSGP